jgi:hypothetical protein
LSGAVDTDAVGAICKDGRDQWLGLMTVECPFDEAVGVGMSSVATPGNILQVVEAVVRLVAVDMVCATTNWAGSVECLEYQPVDTGALEDSIPQEQADVRITAGIDPRVEKSLSSPVPYIAIAGNLVPLIDGQDSPSRAHDLELLSGCSWPLGEAYSIFWCESTGDWGAISPDGSNFGGMQINAIHAWRLGGNLDLLLIPEVNVRVACDIYRDNAGWGPWACKPGGVP